MDMTDPVDVMARTVYGESRGEGQAGWTAVAWVINNRAKKPGWWGHDVISVCTKPMQFDCWNSNDPNCSVVANVSKTDGVFAEILKVCEGVLHGDIPDPTHGSTYYFVTSMPRTPAWALGKVPAAIIGRQSFFNNIS